MTKLIPFSKEERQNISKEAIRAIKNLRTGVRLEKKLSIKQMRAEGKRLD